jgi:hypothetical protein
MVAVMGIPSTTEFPLVYTEVAMSVFMKESRYV